MTDLAHVLDGVARATGPADPVLDEALADLPAQVTSARADEHARMLLLGVRGVPAAGLLDLWGERSDLGALPRADGTPWRTLVHERPGVTFAAYHRDGDVATLAAVWPGADGGPELHPRTGTLRVGGRVVGPATTRLAADAFRVAGHARWTERGTGDARLRVEPDGWLVDLHHEDELLTLVTLYSKEPPVRDADPAAEERRRAIHDAVAGGAAGEHPWGSVWSGYDERAGFSALRIRYLAPDRDSVSGDPGRRGA